ncbi:hypothetical protein SKAU_G00126350 [Synaphobranchus kaupii]|uniref:Uncharacterized protein n=1 Tax=Synaphobranchus kaupii TaxID=118154 RepID=A0A9Q1FPR9_SYNKA|nr:hypothetical protein SKAU_G00126350 [Synaphobranchus kaupii]
MTLFADEVSLNCLSPIRNRISIQPRIRQSGDSLSVCTALTRSTSSTAGPRCRYGCATPQSLSSNTSIRSEASYPPCQPAFISGRIRGKSFLICSGTARAISVLSLQGRDGQRALLMRSTLGGVGGPAQAHSMSRIRGAADGIFSVSSALPP